MDKEIDYLVYSDNEKESQYVFKQTIRLLKDKIIKYDYSKKTVAFANFTIRFCSVSEYERLHLQSLRAKEFYSRWFERQLDNYEKQNRENDNG